MKAKAGKTDVIAKTPANAKGKPVKAVVVAQSAKKPSMKPAGKVAGKPAVKTGFQSRAMTTGKNNPKTPSKPGVKPTTKPPAKAAAKTPVTAAKPLATKPVAKPAGTVKNQKPAPKGAAKTVNSVSNKHVTKPAAKPVARASATPIAKPVAKPVTKTIARAVGKADVKSKPKTAVLPAAPAAKVRAANAVPTSTQAAKPTPPVAVSAVATAAGIPVKAGRPSSRLAQLTVPSMAQSVASTAAKSSFTQSTALPLIVPPLPSATKKDPKLANNWKTKPVEQLVDAELLSMPDSEYMNDKQMAVFRLKLSILKQDILNSASDTTEHLREDTVVVPDPADRATIEEEHALELRTRDRERKLLKKIEQSINRIDAGDYGYCDETGEPIGVGRLLARPTATLSLEAQQRRELKQKMFGD